MQTRASLDSLASELPPVVVDKRSGALSRPFAAGTEVTREIHVLGDDQWIIATPARPKDTGPNDAVAFHRLSREWCANVVQRLAHFRIRPAQRDEGDALAAEIVAHSPEALERGLATLALSATRPGGGRSRYRDWDVLVTPDRDRATVRLWIAGNDGDAWSIGDEDVRAAVHLEREIENAPWIRGFLEPVGSLTPDNRPELYRR